MKDYIDIKLIIGQGELFKLRLHSEMQGGQFRLREHSELHGVLYL